jgi:RimJ/RimL family protein N-acetyltransferase
MTLAPADSARFAALVDWLGDSLDTVVPLHALLTRRCRVWLDGPEAAAPRACVVLADYVPREPWVFGSDAGAAAALLHNLPEWTCVNVSLDFADAMTDAMSRATGRSVERHGDLYFIPGGQLALMYDERVRLLTRDDAALFHGSPDDARPGSAEFVDLLLREGLCAAAVIDGHVVAQAHAWCITPRHAEIGARTGAAHRGRGLGAACASLLCARLQGMDRVPVWSTGESNLASQRVAQKIGLKLVHRRVYLSLARDA